VNIRLPVKKKTEEYNKLTEVIKNHMMYAEQEALYNNYEECKAHVDASLYYLKNIIE